MAARRWRGRRRLLDGQAELLAGRVARAVGDLQVKVNVPVVSGVPASSSSVWLRVMSESSSRPGGSWPETTVQVTGSSRRSR
jgi:hypothetical protein